ncbi:MAG: cytochrome C oxidase subunit IV family protein [Acidobacteriia bacterium]|nr:cytochrome C oxidase subunit IV family protein [Terriglobia bacterium]
MSSHTESHTHHGGPKIYTANLLALLFLTVITVAAASFNFGSANVVIALAIATVKATLVGLFFMHLIWDKPVNAIIAIAGFLFLGIFLMFDFIDVGSRVNLQPRNMPNMENATPAPDTMNPLKTAPPKPLEPAPAAEEHK